MSNLFATGIRPAVDQYLLDEAAKVREYGDYWSASSAGYCMRRNIFERLKVPHVAEDARKQRVFSAGHVFHDWLQKLTRDAGLSIAQEVELQDEDLMVRGHFDDLVLLPVYGQAGLIEVSDERIIKAEEYETGSQKHLILYDYKTAHSRSFTYSKGRPMSWYHRLQLGTYMYMLNQQLPLALLKDHPRYITEGLKEGRILTISKDDLRLDEKQLLWSEELSSEVRDYWTVLNQAWATYNKTGELPSCGCADHENGFLAKEAWNGYFYEGEPCSEQYFKEWLAKETSNAE